MKFILTNFVEEREMSVTRECVDRVKGELTINRLIEKVKQTGEPVEIHFEGDYDLKVEKGGDSI